MLQLSTVFLLLYCRELQWNVYYFNVVKSLKNLVINVCWKWVIFLTILSAFLWMFLAAKFTEEAWLLLFHRGEWQRHCHSEMSPILCHLSRQDSHHLWSAWNEGALCTFGETSGTVAPRIQYNYWAYFWCWFIRLSSLSSLTLIDVLIPVVYYKTES
jgi:hypothetical protein